MTRIAIAVLITLAVAGCSSTQVEVYKVDSQGKALDHPESSHDVTASGDTFQVLVGSSWVDLDRAAVTSDNKVLIAIITSLAQKALEIAILASKVAK